MNSAWRPGWFWKSGVGAGMLALLLRAGPAAWGQVPQPRQVEPCPSSVVLGAAFTPDGQYLVLTSADKIIHIYELSKCRRVAQLKGHQYRVWTVAFSPDGRTLASCSGEYATPQQPGEIKIWSLPAGKEVAALTGHQGLVFDVLFSPDGKQLLSASWDGTIKVWDVSGGPARITLMGHQGAVRRLRCAPDGKVFASAGFDGSVRIWDAKTFKCLRHWAAHAEGVQCLAFSPCGRYLATAARPVRPAPAEIVLWDWNRGQVQARLEGPHGAVLSLDFSPDGRMLAVGGGWINQFGEVHLYEVASGRERVHLGKHKEWVEVVCFSPQGRDLLAGGGLTLTLPGEVSLWSLDRLVPHALPRPGNALSPEELDNLWEALADLNAIRAYQAIRILEATPLQAVKLLRARLRPSLPPPPGQLKQLIDDLDSDIFARREQAMKRLADLDEQAAPALRQALSQTRSLEMSRRIQQLLARLEVPITAPTVLRAVRAVEVLQHLGTPEAHKLLVEWAQAPANTRLVQEARLALRCLQQRK
jgi:hypothetical protein